MAKKKKKGFFNKIEFSCYIVQSRFFRTCIVERAWQRLCIESKEKKRETFFGFWNPSFWGGEERKDQKYLTATRKKVNES
jgi:hypothetical protein